jgi:hypothetical protein
MYVQPIPGADPGFQVRGAHLKKLRRAEEGANILGVFRVKNHYFTPKNHSFYNYGGRREKFWGISCEKSRFYAKKTFFSNFRGAPPLDPPLVFHFIPPLEIHNLYFGKHDKGDKSYQFMLQVAKFHR